MRNIFAVTPRAGQAQICLAVVIGVTLAPMRLRFLSFWLLAFCWLFTTPLQAEAPPREKIPAHNQWSLGFGPVILSSVNAEGVGVGLEGGRVWDVDIASVKLFGSFAIRGSAWMTQLGVGVTKFLLDEDTAPYLAADLGYGISKAQGGFLSGESASGFVLGGGGGFNLFRRSEINVDIGIRVALQITETSLGHPSLMLFRVALLF